MLPFYWSRASPGVHGHAYLKTLNRFGVSMDVYPHKKINSSVDLSLWSTLSIYSLDRFACIEQFDAISMVAHPSTKNQLHDKTRSWESYKVIKIIFSDKGFAMKSQE